MAILADQAISAGGGTSIPRPGPGRTGATRPGGAPVRKSLAHAAETAQKAARDFRARGNAPTPTAPFDGHDDAGQPRATNCAGRPDTGAARMFSPEMFETMARISSLARAFKDAEGRWPGESDVEFWRALVRLGYAEPVGKSEPVRKHRYSGRKKSIDGQEGFRLPHETSGALELSAEVISRTVEDFSEQVFVYIRRFRVGSKQRPL